MSGMEERPKSGNRRKSSLDSGQRTFSDHDSEMRRRTTGLACQMIDTTEPNKPSCNHRDA
jgi:hypothetical protein